MFASNAGEGRRLRRTAAALVADAVESLTEDRDADPEAARRWSGLSPALVTKLRERAVDRATELVRAGV